MADTGRISIAIAAMGGQGGGVLADWIVAVAEGAGFIAQATSVPGVAQRTGATIYYLEIIPDSKPGAAPVLALMPVPGDVDVVVAAELVEAGRAVQRGLVTPDRTTLIASSHRAYAYAEKSAMGDGRVSSAQTISALESAAKRLICFDMQALADAHDTVISATLFGALAGSGALPFAQDQFEAAITATGKAVERNLAAFRAAFALPGDHAASPPAAPVSPREPSDGTVAALVARIDADYTGDVRDVVRNGAARLLDYQDTAYAALYLDRLAAIGARAKGADEVLRQRLLGAVARHLALWMSYEDTIRVADLKTRGERFARCRTEVRAGSDEIVQLVEFMHPRVEEVADTLPAFAGRWLMRTPWLQQLLRRTVLRERRIPTSHLGGFLLLYAVGGLRRVRRTTYRYVTEQARIERWLARIAAALPADPALAIEIARCQNLVKGYGDTHARGLANFERIMRTLDARSASAAELRAWYEAALADENGAALDARLGQPA